jgi:hypothetical protein
MAAKQGPERHEFCKRTEMPRSKDEYEDVNVPASVASWLYVMSRRVGAPAHRVVRVLLDRYIQQLPVESQRRLTEILRRCRERTIQ